MIAERKKCDQKTTEKILKIIFTNAFRSNSVNSKTNFEILRRSTNGNFSPPIETNAIEQLYRILFVSFRN